mmetsp:Transcript_22586/g.46577  ORF Transcript_22586/g.46577 Transcript_22586/m.46577 type:complete len:102 (+) Transcript_22586:86-391(+)
MTVTMTMEELQDDDVSLANDDSHELLSLQRLDVGQLPRNEVARRTIAAMPRSGKGGAFLYWEKTVDASASRSYFLMHAGFASDRSTASFCKRSAWEDSLFW